MKCTKGHSNCFRCGPEGECLILTARPKRQPCSFYKRTEFDYDTPFLHEKYGGVWKMVRGWDGKYWVSNKGEVLGGHGIVTRRYLKDKAYVRLYDYGFISRTYVADLVADAFVPGDGEIIFKDKDFRNCKAENLERKEDYDY